MTSGNLSGQSFSRRISDMYKPGAAFRVPRPSVPALSGGLLVGDDYRTAGHPAGEFDRLLHRRGQRSETMNLA